MFNPPKLSDLALDDQLYGDSTYACIHVSDDCLMAAFFRLADPVKGPIDVIGHSDGDSVTIPARIGIHAKTGQPLVGTTTRLSPETSADITGLCAALGRSFDELVTSGRYDHLELRRGPNGEAELCLGEHRYTAVEWLARLLKNVAITLESRTGYDEHTYILLHSASLDLYQQSCLKVAAERAGLKVIRLLRHSVAAALGLGWTYHKNRTGKSLRKLLKVGKRSKRRKISDRLLVTYTGSACTEVAVLEMCDEVVEVLSVASDRDCGIVALDKRSALHRQATARLSSNADGQPAQKCFAKLSLKPVRKGMWSLIKKQSSTQVGEQTSSI